MMSTSRYRWAVYGALFGVAFPLLAAGIRLYQLGITRAGEAFVSDPLLWIICTAPVFLGAFAWLGGSQHDAVRELTEDLERRVVARTNELQEVLAHTKLVLNSAGDAFISIDLTGKIVGEPSQAAINWFGPHGGREFAQWIFGDHSLRASHFGLGLDQVAQDFLPFEVSIDQLIRRHQHGERIFAIDYRRIEHEGQLSGLLVVIRDATLQEQAAIAEADRYEQQAVIEKILRDAQGFRRFREECAELIDVICTTDKPTTRLRALHTVKGSAALVGFASLSTRCHQIEDELATASDAWCDSLGDELQVAWAHSINLVRNFMSLLEDDSIRVPQRELSVLLDRMKEEKVPATISQLAHAWTLPLIAPQLHELSDHARRTAARLGKQLQVSVRSETIRLDVNASRGFWQCLVHVVNNSVDHGVETPEERIDAGKSPLAEMVIEAQDHDTFILVSIYDDGAGLNWDSLAKTAAKMGIVGTTHEDLVAALFVDGFSTRTQITELSGRGVGLAAVKAACDELGVSVRVDSWPSQGTVFEFQIPKTTARRRALAA